MTYCFKCLVCDYRTEQSARDPAPTCVHPDSPPEHDWSVMVRDYQAENALVDRFSLRQDVRGSRQHRADPLPPDEAHRVNKERMSR